MHSDPIDNCILYDHYMLINYRSFNNWHSIDIKASNKSAHIEASSLSNMLSAAYLSENLTVISVPLKSLSLDSTRQIVTQ